MHHVLEETLGSARQSGPLSGEKGLDVAVKALERPRDVEAASDRPLMAL